MLRSRSSSTRISRVHLQEYQEFVYKNIVCRYGVPHTIVLDTDTQFDYKEFKEFYDDLQIKKVFTSVAQLQANGHVKAVNKTIKKNLKT